MYDTSPIYRVIGRMTTPEGRIRTKVMGVSDYYMIACEICDYLNNTQTKWECRVKEIKPDDYDSLFDFIEDNFWQGEL